MFGGNVFNGNKLKKLNLSFNQLSTLNSNLFALLVSLGTLDISGVSCRCYDFEETFCNYRFCRINSQLCQWISSSQVWICRNYFWPTIKSKIFPMDSSTLWRRCKNSPLKATSWHSFQTWKDLKSWLTFVVNPWHWTNNFRRLLKVTIGNNPWQCICLRETIIWLRQNRVQVDDNNFNSPFPSCVVVPEKSCVKDPSLIAPYQLQDKYSDAISAAEMEFGRKRFEL